MEECGPPGAETYSVQKWFVGFFGLGFVLLTKGRILDTVSSCITSPITGGLKGHGGTSVIYITDNSCAVSRLIHVTAVL